MPGGLGGEDIWKVSVNGDSYGTPENLGNKVNSADNEIFPFIAEDETLYFSSNKEGGLGGLDVYKFKNNTLTRLGAPVNSEKDDFAFTLNQKEKVGFVSSNRDETDDIYLITPICKLFANITVIDQETKQVINAAKLDILDDEKLLQSVIISDNTYAAKLACEKAFYLKASKEGYEDATHTIEKTINGNEIEVVIEMTPVAKPIVTDKEVILEEIYFVFDKSYITEQGKTELDKLVSVMNQYPNMTILVKSHTDNIGDNAYNLDLSNRRAKSTVDYIISKGITQERISGKGYGETSPKVDCERCTIEENKQNRRSEFIIVK
jgi:outer membrane protein OmpA-like peptidoglycan-associated protein